MSRRPDVTFTQLRYFERAAAHGSMTKAAAELCVAQSAVSAAVAQLERQAGIQLFIRQRARGLILTPAGEEFLRDTRAVIAHLNEVLDAARGSGSQVRGRIRVACFVTLAPFVLPELLSDLAREHPDIEVEVIEGEAEEISAALRTGTAEMALCYDLGLGQEFARQVITDAEPHVILSTDHRLARRGRVHLADLAAEPFVLLDLPHSREYFQGLLASAGVTPHVRHRSGSYETVRGLVARGHGYSLLNQRPVGDLTYGGAEVAVRPIADDVLPLPIVIARLAAVRPTARARAVAARAQTVLQSTRPGG